MKRHAFILVALPLALGLGCDHDRYELKLRYEGATLHRELTFSRGDGEGDKRTYVPSPGEKVAALAKVYPKHVSKREGQEHVFSGTFKGSVPNDVGNSGTFTHLGSSMGHVAAYLERFRGDDDLAGQILRQFQAADTLTDLLIGYLESQLGKQKGFEKLRAFMDTDLRRDLKNVAACVRFGCGPRGLGEDEEDFTEIVARVCQYFCERDYFRPRDVPSLFRLVKTESKTGRSKGIEELVSRLMTAKVKVKERDLTNALAKLLGDPERLGESLPAYIAQTREYKTWLAERQKRAKEDPNPAEENSDDPGPNPDSFLEQCVAELFGFEPMADHDELEVEFAAGAEPLYTNGDWHEDRKLLLWFPRRIQQADAKRMRIPRIYYAVWARPDEEFQKARFGKAVFTGDDLVEYCVWRAGLTPAEGKKWDNFVASLRPDEGLIGKLEGFVLAGYEEDYARDILEKIISAVRPEADPESKSGLDPEGEDF